MLELFLHVSINQCKYFQFSLQNIQKGGVAQPFLHTALFNTSLIDNIPHCLCLSASAFCVHSSGDHKVAARSYRIEFLPDSLSLLHLAAVFTACVSELLPGWCLRFLSGDSFILRWLTHRHHSGLPSEPSFGCGQSTSIHYLWRLLLECTAAGRKGEGEAKLLATLCQWNSAVFVCSAFPRWAPIWQSGTLTGVSPSRAPQSDCLAHELVRARRASLTLRLSCHSPPQCRCRTG